MSRRLFVHRVRYVACCFDVVIFIHNDYFSGPSVEALSAHISPMTVDSAGNIHVKDERISPANNLNAQLHPPQIYHHHHHYLAQQQHVPVERTVGHMSPVINHQMYTAIDYDSGPVMKRSRMEGWTI